MLAEEPNLQLVGAQDVADCQIVGPVVAQFISPLGKFTARPNDDFVGVQQARELYRDLFTSARRTFAFA